MITVWPLYCVCVCVCVCVSGGRHCSPLRAESHSGAYSHLLRLNKTPLWLMLATSLPLGGIPLTFHPTTGSLNVFCPTVTLANVSVPQFSTKHNECS